MKPIFVRRWWWRFERGQRDHIRSPDQAHLPGAGIAHSPNDVQGYALSVAGEADQLDSFSSLYGLLNVDECVHTSRPFAEMLAGAAWLGPSARRIVRLVIHWQAPRRDRLPAKHAC